VLVRGGGTTHKVYLDTLKNISQSRGMGHSDTEEMKDEPNVITTTSRPHSRQSDSKMSPRPTPIHTSKDSLVQADTPTMQIDTATLPPEERELKRDVGIILKWKAPDYDTPLKRAELKQHYDNIHGAYTIDNSSKDSMRKKLIGKALEHIKSLLRELGFAEKKG
jgi:hypothetical protein